MIAVLSPKPASYATDRNFLFAALVKQPIHKHGNGFRVAGFRGLGFMDHRVINTHNITTRKNLSQEICKSMTSIPAFLWHSDGNLKPVRLH